MSVMKLWRGWVLLTSVTVVGLSWNSIYAGPGCCGGPAGGSAPKPRVYGIGSSEPVKPRPPEPYRGQKRCPVCNSQLGVHGEPTSVEASLTVPEKKTFWQKIGLAKSSPEKVSYFVCGPECAAQAQETPNTFLISVIAGRSDNR